MSPGGGGGALAFAAGLCIITVIVLVLVVFLVCVVAFSVPTATLLAQPRQHPLELTLCLLHYENVELLEINLANYAALAPGLREHLQFLVVDDGSSCVEEVRRVLERAKQHLRIAAWHIEVDVPWNMPEANNLALKQTGTEWALRCDLDVVFEQKALEDLMFRFAAEPGRLYDFQCILKHKDAREERIQPHPNIWLFRKADYFSVGGYDEYFSGHYGYEDIEFHERARKKLRRVRIPVPCTLLGDRRTARLDRRTEVNAAKLREVQDRQQPAAVQQFSHGESYRRIC